MANLDRRGKMALDESYRYYRKLDKNGEYPDIYHLARCLKTISACLEIADHHQFKLTRQLWRRIHHALFDKLITSFPGYVCVFDRDGTPALPRGEVREDGVVEFRGDGLRRADDVFRLEIKDLYPATFINLSKTWKTRGAHVIPGFFGEVDCSLYGCPIKPMILGLDVLDKESTEGKDKAYGEWWDLYWQAYCTRNHLERNGLYRKMDEIELVWGNLYY